MTSSFIPAETTHVVLQVPGQVLKCAFLDKIHVTLVSVNTTDLTEPDALEHVLCSVNVVTPPHLPKGGMPLRDLTRWILSVYPAAPTGPAMSHHQESSVLTWRDLTRMWCIKSPGDDGVWRPIATFAHWSLRQEYNTLQHWMTTPSPQQQKGIAARTSSSSTKTPRQHEHALATVRTFAMPTAHEQPLSASSSSASSYGHHHRAALKYACPFDLFANWWAKNKNAFPGDSTSLSCWDALPAHLPGWSRNPMCRRYWTKKYSDWRIKQELKQKYITEVEEPDGSVTIIDPDEDILSMYAQQLHQDEHMIEDVLVRLSKEKKDSSLLPQTLLPPAVDVRTLPASEWTEQNVRLWLRRMDREQNLKADPVLLSIVDDRRIAGGLDRDFACQFLLPHTRADVLLGRRTARPDEIVTVWVRSVDLGTNPTYVRSIRQWDSHRSSSSAAAASNHAPAFSGTDPVVVLEGEPHFAPTAMYLGATHSKPTEIPRAFQGLRALFMPPPSSAEKEEEILVGDTAAHTNNAKKVTTCTPPQFSAGTSSSSSTAHANVIRPGEKGVTQQRRQKRGAAGRPMRKTRSTAFAADMDDKMDVDT